MAYFSLFIDIEGAEGLIIGSGKHALEKIERLEPYGAKLRVVEEFKESDLDSRPDFVIIACDDMEERRKIVCWDYDKWSKSCLWHGFKVTD